MIITNQTGANLLSEVIKSIKKEIKEICSIARDSILRDRYEGVKQFSWETVWQELMSNVPTLMIIIINKIDTW